MTRTGNYRTVKAALRAPSSKPPKKRYVEKTLTLRTRAGTRAEVSARRAARSTWRRVVRFPRSRFATHPRRTPMSHRAQEDGGATRLVAVLSDEEDGWRSRRGRNGRGKRIHGNTGTVGSTRVSFVDDASVKGILQSIHTHCTVSTPTKPIPGAKLLDLGPGSISHLPVAYSVPDSLALSTPRATKRDLDGGKVNECRMRSTPSTSRLGASITVRASDIFSPSYCPDPSSAQVTTPTPTRHLDCFPSCDSGPFIHGTDLFRVNTALFNDVDKKNSSSNAKEEVIDGGLTPLPYKTRLDFSGLSGPIAYAV